VAAETLPLLAPPVGSPGHAVSIVLGLAMIAVAFGKTALSVHRVPRLLRLRHFQHLRRVREALLGVALIAPGVRVAAE
jgi:threonine/homoserine/homoserine lactone efflux protein